MFTKIGTASGGTGIVRSTDRPRVDGYEVLEVILDPDDIVGAPEDGRVRRQHFEQVLGEKRG